MSFDRFVRVSSDGPSRLSLDGALTENLLDENKEGKAPKPLKSDSTSRWIVLCLSCVAMIGNYYCFDIPSASKTQLQAYAGLSESEFNLLYTVYSIPNIILPFFGGYLCDMLGAARAFSIFAGTLVAGQAIFSFGVNAQSVGIMFLGRIVYGLGGENMAVGGSVLLAEWFEGKEMALAMGLNVAVSRVGSVVNDVASPAIADAAGVGAAVWTGVLVCAVSFGCTAALGPVDAAAQACLARRLALSSRGGGGGGGGGEALTATPSAAPAPDSQLQQQEVRAVAAPGAADRASALGLVEGGGGGGGGGVLAEPPGDAPPAAALGSPAQHGAQKEEEKKKENPLAGCADVRRYQPAFWLLALCCVVTYGCVIPFNSVASSLLLERDFFRPQPSSSCALRDPSACASAANAPNGQCRGGSSYKPPLPDFIDEDEVDCTDKAWRGDTGSQCAAAYCDGQRRAARAVSLCFSVPYFISGALSPFLGFAVDRFGGRAWACLGSAALLAAVHAGLAWARFLDPYVPMVGQGVAYSLFAAALWPSVPYLVPLRSVGVAYGVVTAVQNLGLAAVPVLVSATYQASGGRYIPSVELLFVALALCGSLSALLLNFAAPQLNERFPRQCPDTRDDEDDDDDDDDDGRAVSAVDGASAGALGKFPTGDQAAEGHYTELNETAT